MLDWFNLLLLFLILVIVGFIVIAIRKTMMKMPLPGESGDEARKLAERIRQRDVRCPRCKQQSSALLGTETQYKCDSCNFVFEGPEHIPLS